ncbi:MAG: SDR family oxidoreductase [Deltaproteobacteria bacterium]|nr:SDR family oxidoreductase [Deltaproteobacteria bacterium]
MGAQRLVDVRIVITGTSRGLGRALALAAGAEGARLVVHARDAAAADGLAEELRARGADAVAVAGDLRDPTLGPRVAAAAAAAFGGLDVMVLNAGALGPMAPLVDTDLEAFAEVMDVNVDAQVRLLVASLPMLVSARGMVVWMSTGLGRFGLPRYGSYAASKHAVEGLMKVLAAEHGDDGLVSVAVAPGMVETDMLQRAIGPHDPAAFKTPAQYAEQMVRLIAGRGPALNGLSLELDMAVGTVPANG